MREAALSTAGTGVACALLPVAAFAAEAVAVAVAVAAEAPSPALDGVLGEYDAVVAPATGWPPACVACDVAAG